MTKARYHLKARPEAVQDKNRRPECTLARCLCRLDGPQEPKGGYHGIRVRQPRKQGPMWLQMAEDDGAPLVYFHQVKHMWVGYADGQSGAVEEDAEAGERKAKAQVLKALKVEPKQAQLWMQMQRDAQVAAFSGQHEQNGGGVGAHETGLGIGAVCWGDGAPQQGNGLKIGPRHGNAPGTKGNGHG